MDPVMDADEIRPAKVVTVEIEPVGRRVRVRAGARLLDVCRAASVELVAVCGGIGACDTCRLRRITGPLSPPTITETETFSSEDLDEGFRLACQAEVLDDVRVAIPPESLATPQRLVLEGEHVPLEPESPVFSVDVELPSAGGDIDAQSLLAARTGGQPAPPTVPPGVARQMSQLRPEQNGRVRLALHRQGPQEHLVGILKVHESMTGVALDLGTTKLAGYLVDLESGSTLARAGAMNPQISFGEDVVTRIAYANRSRENRLALREMLCDTVDTLVGELCTLARVDRDRVVDLVAVGNTAMHHLFAGLPVRQLGEAPYAPATVQSILSRAGDLGIGTAPGAFAYLPPSVAGYVGADHLAMLLATDVWRSPKRVVALDVGTNTEISVVDGGRLFSCSCASGPAFEGAHIREGMRAMPGAVERVRMAGGRLHVHSIGDVPPIGICGSGIVDVVAALMAQGAIDERGAFRFGEDGVRERDGMGEFVLVPAARTGHGRDIVVTRRDVHEIQLAKAAIRAGIDVLLDEIGVRPRDIDEFVVAGAFGTYVDMRSAIAIGMFPGVPLERVRQVGNAAGMGALRLLLSSRHRQLAEEIRDRIDYVELTNHPKFNDRFLDGLMIPSVSA
jgi:uncharacterized 2Fe-2S/4Fe-4S cluster protein (DUF4445 family)